jgi:insertion element IS1 protein InsB
MQKWTLRWSFVASKKQQRWLWHAIDHRTGQILAPHQDHAFKQLQLLLEQFAIQHFYTDGWRAYERHLDPQQHTIGKANTQTIKGQHLTMRTRIKRLARKTICFSRVNQLA